MNAREEIEEESMKKPKDGRKWRKCVSDHVSVETLRNLFQYDPSSGVLTHVRTGKPAGSKASKGCRVSVLKEDYMAHRIIWLLMTGDEPPEVIDHKDGNPFNNKWSNLRSSSHSLNGRNKPTRGYTWDSSVRKWKAQMVINGKQKFLGRFDSEKEAHEAYMNACKLHYADVIDRKLAV